MIERLFPDFFLKSVTLINVDILSENKIKGLILDIDNTLIDYERNISENTMLWLTSMKENNIKMYLVSNNRKEKVEEMSKRLDIPYISNASKPFSKGFLMAIQKMQIKNTETAVIGDQIFTDVYGGNRLNMLTILVEQVGSKDIWITKIKRPLEKYVLKRYLLDNNNHTVAKLKWKEKSAFSKKI